MTNIKLLVFDLDGVLATTKSLHYDSLNTALRNVNEKYVINIDEHHKIYDGLPTYKKLSILNKNKGLPEEHFEQIYNDKQRLTLDLIKTSYSEDTRLKNILKQLKKDDYKIYVASNSIRDTVKLLLYKTGLIEYVDYYISNEDVNNNKPNAEMYLKAMIHAGVNPKETLIIEDSPRGIEAAINSGGEILIVKTPDDVTYENIKNKINKNVDTNTELLQLEDLNVLIPMAGAGSRFQTAGYSFPKPLIDIKGKPMIQEVVESLKIKANYIYIVKKEHYDEYNLKYLLNAISPDCKIIQVDSLTEGAACTTLLAKEYINVDKPLIIANSDQYIDWNPINFYYKMIETKSDGGILTFRSTHPKWSYVKLDEWGYVVDLAEKKVISDIATVGIYWYNKGSEYVKYAEQMIEKNIRINGEFYVAPIYNEYINDGKRISTFDVDKMMGLGTPEDLETYLK